MRESPYQVVEKPYGRALLELAHGRSEVVCLSGDLTRQCEVDLFRDELPDRFFNAGMAEANMMGVAGGLARRGFLPFVHTFGVFATRRAYDQVAMAIAYPNLPVRIVGFMPGLSSPGGPSHQAIDDVALMRALPNMTVIDLADADSIRAAVPAIVDLPGPVYLRLKRGEIPVVLDDEGFDLEHAQVLHAGGAVALVASGMMLMAAIAARDVLSSNGVSAGLVHVPVIKPLDTDTIRAVSTQVDAVVVAENHSVVGGLGSAVAEAVADAGTGTPVIRVGMPDRFGDAARDHAHLFEQYGLTTNHVIAAAWRALGRTGNPPVAGPAEQAPNTYAPV